MDDASWLMLRGICRGLHLAGYFTAAGAMVLPAVLLHRGAARAFKPLAWAGFAVALLAGAAWFVLQAAYFASAQNFADVLGALPLVAGDTLFGRLLLGRLAVLLAALLLFQANRPRPAALLGFCGVVAEAWLGHGGAMDGRVGTLLLAVSCLHIAAAALWLGTLPALFLAIWRLPAPAVLARRYSPLGMGCVALLLLTALVQYLVLIGRMASLFTSGYGLAAFTKILLLAGLIALAARNRHRLAPALPASRAALLRAIAGEMLLGLLALIAAGILLQFAPPAMAGMASGVGG